MDIEKINLGIIGLGYVGLPLALEFSKKRPVIAYDIDKTRIIELNSGYDRCNEVGGDDFKNGDIKFTNNYQDLSNCNLFIVTVPTPVDEMNKPDLSYLIESSKSLCGVIKNGDVVVYESTVYPGVTEEVCAHEIEINSGLKLNEDFFVGYSPERINPGDKQKKIGDIVKIVSGSNDEVAHLLQILYSSIIKAGVHRAPTIKVAEASKVIENIQRDVNIALMNEFSMILNALDINIYDVLKAAETKWNFLKFKPGLVGGHCIGIDPYYLSYKSRIAGVESTLIDSSRKINEEMTGHLLSLINLKGSDNNLKLKESLVLIAGFTFKENCSDTRNTKVNDLYSGLVKLGCEVDVHDELADKDQVFKDYRINLLNLINEKKYDLILIPVSHEYIYNLGLSYWESILKPNGLIFDIKNIFNQKNNTKIFTL